MERVSLVTRISDSDVTRSCGLTCAAGGGAAPPPTPPRATKSALHLRHPRLPRNHCRVGFLFFCCTSSLLLLLLRLPPSSSSLTQIISHTTSHTQHHSHNMRLGTGALPVAFACCVRRLLLAKGSDVRPGVVWRRLGTGALRVAFACCLRRLMCRFRGRRSTL